MRIGSLCTAGGLPTPSCGQRWGLRVIGAAAAVALHAALFAAVTWGASTGRSKPEPAGQSEVRIPDADGAPVSAIVFLDPTALFRRDGLAPPKSLSTLSVSALLRPRMVSFDMSAPHIAEGDSGPAPRARTSVAEADGAHTALLFGRYLNQIVARIEREWVRPRVAPAGVSLWSSGAARPVRPRFECRVRIVQSTDGQVLQITLMHCDANVDWQKSLVDAIDAASPLPAPPAEALFAHSLVLNFESEFPSCGSPDCADRVAEQ